MKQINSTVLSLYPNTVGVCYAVFNSPNDLADYGIGYVNPVSNKKSMLKVEKYIDYYKPDIVLIRGLTVHNKKSNRRNQKLIDLICKKAKERGLEVYSYNRSQIKDVFREFGVTTKYTISKKLIEWFSELETLELPKRKRWMGEHYNTGVFDAIALALTHFYLMD